MKTNFLMLGMIFSVLIISCSKNDDTDSTTISEDEVGINADIDIASDDVSNVLEEQLAITNLDGSGRGSAMVYAGCATITRTPAVGTVPNVGQTVTKVIDFGTRCVQPNGNILSGKINMSFVYNPSATTQTVTYIFENFYHNARKLNGQKTFTRSMTAATATSQSHPIIVMNMDMLITLTDGRMLTRIGTRTREFVEGFSTSTLTDNVYDVTGNWTTTFPNTTVQSSTITTPLKLKLSCVAPNTSIITQGVISFVRNTNNATLDYGDGSCDNQAVFTLNGVSTFITLRR